MDETRVLFNNLEEVFNRIFELELHNKKLRRKIGGGSNKANNYSTNQSNIDSQFNTMTGSFSPKELLLTTHVTSQDEINQKTGIGG